MCTQEVPKKHVDFHSIGNVYLQNEIGSDKRREAIAFENNTLNSNIRGMILENALFQFLFPQKNGAYDVQTTLS